VYRSIHSYFFVDADRTLDEMLEVLDPQRRGMVDYITWSTFIGPRDLPRITKHCRQMGPLYAATPTEEEIELMEAMFQRGHKLAEEAARCGTRLLIDAEQTRFQPAIDNLVLELQQKYNATTERDTPLIYNTYQCYLKDAPERLHRDVERSERFSYHFGAKLVRGAYMDGERASAKSEGVESPIRDTLEDTHLSYNESVKYLLEKSVVPSDTNIEFMCATHNQDSIEKATKLMDELGIPPESSSIYFAQLYGMADNLTYNLGKHGYNVYKYVPYGKVKEVMPYLLRRAQENSAMLGSASHELRLLRSEMSRRMGWAS
jgi:proline dehydrogenase